MTACEAEERTTEGTENCGYVFFLIRIMSVVLIQLTFLIYLQETTLPPNPTELINL